MRYVVLWSGGYEEPSLFTTDDMDAAKRKYSEFARDMKEDSDRVHLYDLAGPSPTVLLSTYYGE